MPVKGITVHVGIVFAEPREVLFLARPFLRPRQDTPVPSMRLLVIQELAHAAHMPPPMKTTDRRG